MLGSRTINEPSLRMSRINFITANSKMTVLPDDVGAETTIEPSFINTGDNS